MLVADVKQGGDFSLLMKFYLIELLLLNSKIYHNKDVDNENEKGFYKTYKQVVQRKRFYIEFNPKYKYPHMLISTIIEGAHHQRYFAEQLHH